LRKLVTIFLLTLFAIGLPRLFIACRKGQDNAGLTPLAQSIPANLPAPNYQFTDNPLSEEGFQLGRKLFYDGRLSVDNLHPCASCHEQVGGFGTFEHDRSHGVYNSHTLRNAPPLFNLAWNKTYHWDAAFNSLYDEAAQPLHGRLEMGETWDGIISKLAEDPAYREAFKTVFKSPFIKPEFILKALAQFTGNIVSADARYDKMKRGELSFTAAEQNGYVLFQAKCASCHPEPMFTDYSLRNTGLPVDNLLKDYGRMLVTGKSTDSLKFKVPTLRNVLFTSNYMHDGRFNTLPQCINHYRTGVQASPTLDPLLAGGISMTDNQANDLYQFLKTLSDSSLLKNPRYAKP